MSDRTQQAAATFEQAIALVREHGSVAGAAKSSGISRATMQGRITRAIGLGMISQAELQSIRHAAEAVNGPRGAGATPVESVVETGDQREIHKRGINRKVETLEDLIRVCKIDASIWEVERWECKAYQMGSIPRATGGPGKGTWRRPSTKPVTTQLFAVSAKLRRKSGTVLTLERLRVELVSDIRKAVRVAKAPAVARRRFVEGGYLFEFAPVDLHAGKLAWASETVTDYDLPIASDLFRASLDFLLANAVRTAGGRLEQAVFVVGNDVLHIDSKKGQTTAGTPMDVDTRYIKVYRRVVEIHRWAALRLREVCPVVIKVVPGNHDELSSFHLGEILAAYFERDKHVTVDNGPKLRKYHEFGVNLLGFTHGDAQKVDELPLTMAREEPEAWARCPEREFHIGHLHIVEKKEWRPVQTLHSDKGFRVRRLPSLSAHDFWHTRHGYMDRRACQSFLYHRTAGYTGEQSFNVDHFTGKAMA